MWIDGDLASAILGVVPTGGFRVFLQIDEMRAGANTSYNASWLAMEAKAVLSRANITSAWTP